MTENTPTKPTVFISYSHKDEPWKDRFIPQLRALEQAGRIVVWDDRQIDGGDKWYPEIIKAMEEASVAVCIISADYLASGFCVKEEVPFLLQRCERDGMIFIPLLLRPCAWKAFEWLKEIQMLPRDGKNVLVDFRGIEDAVFADVANLILQIVDNPSTYTPPPAPTSVWSPPEKVDIDRLPKTGAELFGRQKELEILDAAWGSESTNIVSLVAWGGVGKSTLVNKWLERMQIDNYRGARRVYAWSFYSQGTGERVTSADLFINHALTWFGDTDPTAGSPWDKGERLAKLIREERTLLVLDGLEPLQSGQTFDRGEIKEPGLVILLTELARQNPGLCLITTREPLTDLYEFGDAVIQKDLEQISDEAGRALLRVGGVQGTDLELEKLTNDFGNHALAINLLAVYLRDSPSHHASKATGIPELDIPEEKGRHPRRVMAALAQRFGDGPEVELLKLLGLFDRPADNDSIHALRKIPVIQGLTDNIRKLTKGGWLRTVETLRKHKLVAAQSHHRPDDLDAHPLVREHFAEQLKNESLDAWRAANYRLYNHLRKSSQVFPNTLNAMMPLYAAIAHACQADRHQQALNQVYVRRIMRESAGFSVKILGAFGTNLSIIRNFFNEPWKKVVDGLDEYSKAFVLNQAGFCLKAMGRITEAAEAYKEGLQARIRQEKWWDAAVDAGSLSELYLTAGELEDALSYAEEGVKFAERTENNLRRRASMTTLADALHHSGRLSEAEDVFRKAEAMQEQHQPHFRFLYSVWGFRYCDLLITQDKYNEVLTRTDQQMVWIGAQALPVPLDRALNYLSSGLARLLKQEKEGLNNFLDSASDIQEAVSILREAGHVDYLVRGLIIRARLNTVRNDFAHASADLHEALSIASGTMKLYEADGHLDYARMYVAMSENEKESKSKQENIEKAREHLNISKEMIERMGYHRRDKDVQEIEAQLARAS